MKKFNMIDEEFYCENCGYKVPKLDYSARDHCLNCLYSKHVDINPGDREETCYGLLKPIDIEKIQKDKMKIIYKCQKCGKIKKNIVANDDNYDEILNIMKNKF